MAYEIVMYSRFSPCPYVRSAKRVLDRERIPYREIYIDEDPAAKQRVDRVDRLPVRPNDYLGAAGRDSTLTRNRRPLAPGASPKGVDRGPMITEPGEVQLENWLRRHGLLGSGG